MNTPVHVLVVVPEERSDRLVELLCQRCHRARTKDAFRSSTHALSTPSWNMKEEFRQHTRHIKQGSN
ncbi:hypothetical protein F443_21112 [Phytophthora nicotianae P1569]|nr:hypothetical protein F443_21112 [Phytophthora nicotianae P1569]